jgi:hypothetical protein
MKKEMQKEWHKATKPNKRRATLHKQKQEWRGRDEKTEKKRQRISRGIKCKG